MARGRAVNELDRQIWTKAKVPIVLRGIIERGREERGLWSKTQPQRVGDEAAQHVPQRPLLSGCCGWCCAHSRGPFADFGRHFGSRLARC